MLSFDLQLPKGEWVAMKIFVKCGLIYSDSKAHCTYSDIVDTPSADNIARANGFDYAERFVKQFDGKVLILGMDYKIKSIKEDFL